LRIAAIALGGCLRGPPVSYGITEDTGGHITYVLGAMEAIGGHAAVTSAEIFTRLFDDVDLGAIHLQRHEAVSERLQITRIDSGDLRYLSKDALAQDRGAFTRALIAELAMRPAKPDLIWAHFADAADVARQVRDALGIPFVYTAHSLAIDKRDHCGSAPNLSYRIAEEDRAIASADAVIGSSRDECERQLRLYPSADVGRIHRITPGVSVPPADDPLAESCARMTIAPFLRDMDKPLILAVARPVHKKNLPRLIEAFAGDPELRESANLAVVAGLRAGLASGEQEQRDVMHALVDAIDRHDLHGHVAWPRTHDQRTIAGLYKMAKRTHGVFVNAALTEPFGLTLIEAAAHGVPVVATRHGGPVDIVSELGHGVLVEPTDTAAISVAIKTLLQDRLLWESHSRSAQERIREWSWPRFADSFVRVALGVVQSKVEPKPSRASLAHHLVISDIDNTLTGCQPGARRFARFVSSRRDTLFGVATGRSQIEARRILGEWGLPEPDVLVSEVGTRVAWRERARYRTDVEFDAMIQQGWNVAAIDAALTLVPGLKLQRDVDQSACKRSYFVEDAGVVEIVRHRLQSNGIAANVVFSHGDLLDVLPPKAGKSAAMCYVANKLGLPLAQVVAIGDSGNDLDMLSDCPNAVVVANRDANLLEIEQRPNVYVARRGHAGGALEGVLRHRFRTRRPGALDRSAAA
jgi:sucrose-phosphate synthase